MRTKANSGARRILNEPTFAGIQVAVILMEKIGMRELAWAGGDDEADVLFKLVCWSGSE